MTKEKVEIFCTKPPNKYQLQMQMFSPSIYNTSLQEKQVVFCNGIFGTVVVFHKFTQFYTSLFN